MSSPDEEWPDCSDAVITTCCRCGKERHCCLVGDPFLSEVYPDESNEPEYCCRPCFMARKGDI